MAGVRGAAESPVELQLVPYPALTVCIDFGDALLVDDASGERKRGSVVVGLAPGSVRGSNCGLLGRGMTDSRSWRPRSLGDIRQAGRWIQRLPSSGGRW
jgi:hypothetical protein